MLPSFPRRRAFLAGALAAALLVVTGCGSGETAQRPQSAASGAYPISIAHKYGSTTITAEPKRIVTVGLTDQDSLLALGVVPVGTTEWLGNFPGAIGPWAQDELGFAAQPEVLASTDGPQYEKIAALRPDLILGLYSALTQEQYDTLSKIAAVVAQPKGHEDYQAPWQVMTKQIGKALGKEAETEKKIADIDARFKAVRDKHPEWKGKTVAVGEPYEPGKYSVFSPKDPKVIFLTEMGFTTSEAYQKALGKENVADLSVERLDVMEADRTVWLGTPETEKAMKAEPLYKKTKVHQEKRDLFLPYENPEIGAALSFNTVLSIPYAIDEVVPMLEAIK